MALFDLLGRAWAMGIVWQLKEGPCTFRELRKRCEDISPSLLNRRLKELRAAQFVECGGPGYRLTPLGEELFDLLEPIGAWAKTWGKHLDTLPETTES